MSFIQKLWKDGYAGQTPITAADLNRIEQALADLFQGGGGGGAAFKQWASGTTYQPGELVGYKTLLMTPRVATDEEPFGGLAAPGTDVTGAGWIRYNVSASAGGTVSLIEYQSSRDANVISNEIFGAGAGFPNGELSYDIALNGTADDMKIGILRGDVSSSLTNNLNGQSGFYGLMMDIYSSRLVVMVDGNQAAATGYNPRTGGDSTFEVWKLTFSTSGSTTTMEVRRTSAGETPVWTTTFTTPTWNATGFKLAIAARTGGSAGVMRVRGTPGAGAQSTKWRRIAGLLETT